MIKIVPAGTGDIPVINSLAYSIWPIAYKEILSTAQMDYMLDLFYSPSSLQQQMQQLGHYFLILYFNEEPAGFASYSLKDNSYIFKLHKLYVNYNQQGAGFGKTLLQEVVKITKAEGGKFLKLNVNRNNKALQFYLKNDFKIISEEDIDIGRGYFMNDYIMEREL